MAYKSIPREQRARLLFDGGVRCVKTQDGWEVPASKGASSYHIHHEGNELLCDCMDFATRSRATGDGSITYCKHLELLLIQTGWNHTAAEVAEMVVC